MYLSKSLNDFGSFISCSIGAPPTSFTERAFFEALKGARKIRPEVTTVRWGLVRAEGDGEEEFEE
jgi:hypothetical protein